MRVKSLLLILLLSFYCFGLTANGQKPFYKNQSEIEAAATEELNTLMKDEKVLKELAKEDIHGTYQYKITINEKSQIASMQFLEKSESGSTRGQNHFNYLVRKYKFNFKTPKGNFYAFNYTFNAP